MEQKPADDLSDEPRECEPGYSNRDDARGPGRSADATPAGGPVPWDAGVVVDTYAYDIQGNLISHAHHDPSMDITCPDCYGAGVMTLLTTRKPWRAMFRHR